MIDLSRFKIIFRYFSNYFYSKFTGSLPGGRENAAWDDMAFVCPVCDNVFLNMVIFRNKLANNLILRQKDPI